MRSLLTVAVVLLGTSTALADLVWQPLATPLPGADGELVRLHDGRLMLVGGASGPLDGSAQTQIYDPSTRLWTAAAPMTEARHWHTATVMADGRVLVTGGTHQLLQDPLATTEIYDPTTNTWSPSTDLPLATVGHSAVAVGDRVVIVGTPLQGFQTRTVDDATWVGSAASNAGSGTLVVLDDGRVLAVGPAVSSYLFDPITHTVTNAPAVPGAPAAATAVKLADGRVLVAGGLSAAVMTAAVNIFDPQTGTWQAAHALPAARWGSAGVLLPGGRVALTGGTLATGDELDVLLYDPTTDLWSFGPRRQFTHLALVGRFVSAPAIGMVFGGQSAGVEALVDLPCQVDVATNAECAAGGVAVTCGTLVREPICNGLDFVTRTSATDAAICPTGGTLFEYGYDTDQDGVLDDPEETGSFPICDGETLTTAFVDVAPGDVCVAGGTSIEVDGEPVATLCQPGAALVRFDDVAIPCVGQNVSAGIDADADDTLDDSEIVSRAVVCDGLDGAPAIITVTPLPTGAQPCLAGGVTIDFGSATTTLCNGGVGTLGARSLSVVAPTDTCDFDGVLLTAGVDDDDSGTLDAGEIDFSATLCDGAPGAAADAMLIEVVPAAGDTCASANVGFDDDDDGVLDAAEIDSTTQLCNGTAGDPGGPGPDGPDAATVLVTSTTPDASACPNGGVTLRAGGDDDDDGTLDDGEVESTSTLCNGIDGEVQAPCTVENHGGGVVHVSCPGEDEIELQGPSEDASGCGAGATSMLGLLFAVGVLLRRRLVIVLAFLGIGGSAFGQMQFSVNATVDGNDGQCSLNEALAESNGTATDCVNTGTAAVVDGAVITIAPGTYPASAGLVRTADTTLRASADGVTIVLAGSLAHDGTADLVLDGVTIDGASFAPTPARACVDWRGVGDVELVGVTLSDCIGRALETHTSGSVRVIESTFRDNAPNGALLVSGDSPTIATALEVMGSTFTDNASTASPTGAGGAISVQAAVNVTVSGSYFARNEAGLRGGALELAQTRNLSATIAGSTFEQSDASIGGAVFALALSNQLSVEGSTFDGNTADQGAAIFSGRSVRVDGSILSRNVAPDATITATDPAVLYVTGSFDTFAENESPAVVAATTVTLRSSLFQDNGVGATPATITLAEALDNVTDANVAVPFEVFTTTAFPPRRIYRPDIDPSFIAAATCAGTDLLGRLRPAGATCEVGAVEIGPPRVTVVPATAVECPIGGQTIVLLDDRENIGAGIELSRTPICFGPDLVVAIDEDGACITYDFGFDTDDDGLIGGTEIEQSIEVCDAVVAVAIDPVLPGATCRRGGVTVTIGADSATLCEPGDALVEVVEDDETGCVTVTTGIDWDGDTSIDDDERGATTTLCHGTDALPVRVTVSDATAAQCPGGGQVAAFGRDVNDDSQITGAEIESSAVVCDGNPSAGIALVSVSATTCPSGAAGRSVATGLDDDGDGVLSVAEQDSVQTICDGARGADGLVPMVMITAADAATCPDGGSVIASGQDLDGDGVLGAGEVLASVDVCNGEDGVAGPDGDAGAATAPLFITAEAASEAECPEGGWVVTTERGGATLTTDTVCNGSDGSSGAACTFTDHGDGTATVSCPDGTIELVLTASMEGGSCSGGSAAGLVGLLAALVFLLRRRLAIVAAVVGIGGSASATDYFITTTVPNAADGQCSLNEAMTHAGSIVGLPNDCSAVIPTGKHRFFIQADGTHVVSTVLTLTAAPQGFEIHGDGPTQTIVQFSSLVPFATGGDVVLDEIAFNGFGAACLGSGPLHLVNSAVDACNLTATTVEVRSAAITNAQILASGDVTIDQATFAGANMPLVQSTGGSISALNASFLGLTGPLVQASGAVTLDFVTLASGSTPVVAGSGVARRSIITAIPAGVTLIDSTIASTAAFALVEAVPGPENSAVPFTLLVPIDDTGIRDTVDAGGVDVDLVSRVRPQGAAADRGALELPVRSAQAVERATALECPAGGQTLLLGADYDASGDITDGELIERIPLCNGPRFLFEVDIVLDCRELFWGYDDDGDGVLDDDEGTALELCDGADGGVTVVDNEPDEGCPAGSYILNGVQICKPGQPLVEISDADEECFPGGVAFRWGRDLDADGVLDGFEQTGEALVCDRFDGAEALVDVAPSEGCPQGGVDLTFGTDTDGDDELGVEEIDSTTTLCNGLDVDGLTALVVVAVANEAQCPDGGSLFASGIDDDDDGVLDPDEIDVSTPLCNGAPGADGSDALVTFVDATAAQCPGGGTVMTVGLDGNDDGALSGNEIVSTTNVCSGAPGADGPSGDPGPAGVGVVIESEAATGCAAGGLRLRTGLDDDRDGVLDDGEIDSDVVVCEGEDGAVGEPCEVLDERTMQCGSEVVQFVIADDLDTDGCNGGTLGWLALLFAIALLARRARVGVAVLSLMLVTQAKAQDTAFDVEQFHPQPHQGANLLGLARSHMLRPLEPSFGLFVHYEDDPLQLAYSHPDGSEDEQVLIDDMLTMELSAGLGIVKWLDVGVVFPMVVNQTGPGLDAFAVGDLRLVPRVRILDAADSGFGLALQAAVWLPTGDEVYHSEGSVRVEPRLALDIHPSGDDTGFAITANVAYQNHAGRQAVDFGNPDTLKFGLGVEIPVISDDFMIQATWFGATGLGNDTGKTVPMEVMGGVGWWVADDVILQAGAGTGLTDGVGTPDVRAYASIAYTPTRNRCGGEVEDKDGFEDDDGCPDYDNDKDGILDVVDGEVDESGFGRCRNEPEDKDGFQDEDGCPDVDNDQDGVLDVSDGARDASGFGKCRDIAEDKDGFEDSDGCPDTDNDQDGILDVADGPLDESGFGRCRNQPENRNGYEDTDGCPDEPPSVMEITDIVYFDFDKDTLQERSYPLLDAVADVMQHHKEFTKIHIEGHADEIGPHAYNSDLSRRRAGRVREYLIGKGVDGARLTSEGYSWDYPVDPGLDEESRAKNRRVVFSILEIDGKPNPSARRLQVKPD